MSDVGASSAKTSFAQHLRRALNHLYNPAVLRSSPLARLFGVDQREDRISALQRILTDAIEALKPDSSVPPKSRAWRVYNVLYYRYTEQSTQSEVAADLGLSIRQLGREQRTALEVLADYLWNRYNLQSKVEVPSSGPSQTPEEASPTNADTLARQRELEWLKSSIPTEATDVAAMLRAVLKTIAPLLKASGARVQCNIPGSLPTASVQQTTARQALMNVVLMAARSAPRGRVVIEVQALPRNLCVHVRATKHFAADATPTADDTEALAMARQLVRISGGSLEITPCGDEKVAFSARLTFPTAEDVPVLIIDDNADTLQLLEKYLSGSRYRFIGTTDPERALPLAEQTEPSLIVMDLMLPEISGWELLGRLREHPRTGGIPIVVCTILSEEQLALTLGAAEFIRKPVDRTTLLSTLDRLYELQSRESS